MKPKIPIFVICHNRHHVLKESLESYAKYIKTPFEVILFDQKSTYGPTIEYMKSLEKSGMPVIWNYRNGNLEEMSHDLNIVIQEWLKLNPAPYYVVTDPDIALDGCQGDVLEYFAFLLEKFTETICVGPMLRIDDIPDFYPIKDEVLYRHTDQFWSKVPKAIEYKNIKYHLIPAFIDTTFAMYRADFEFRNCNVGLRTYAPYMARHLDWYLNPTALTDDQIFYMQEANYDMAHWGGGFLDYSLKTKSNRIPF